MSPDHSNSGSDTVLPLEKMPGGAIRDVAMGLLRLTGNATGPYATVYAVVLDTNVIFNELSWMARHRRESKLMGEASTGFVRLLVSTQVVREVAERMGSYAKQVRLSESKLQAVWAEYQQHLRIIDVNEVRADRLVALAARDPDDLPTARLIEVAAPAVALSRDRDLIDTEYAAVELRTLFRRRRNDIAC